MEERGERDESSTRGHSDPVLKKQGPSFDSKVKLLGFLRVKFIHPPQLSLNQADSQGLPEMQGSLEPRGNEKHFHVVLLCGNNSIHKEKTGDLKHTGSGGPKVYLNEVATGFYLSSVPQLTRKQCLPSTGKHADYHA